MSRSSSSPNETWIRFAGVTSAVIGMVASAAIVWHTSHSAFSATTSNGTNTWSAGSVALSDDDGSSALFTIGNLEPGSTGANCITVTSNGVLPTTVKLYGKNETATRGLDSYVDLTITEGTGGGFGSCAGFAPLATGSSVFSGTLSAFAGSATDFASGLGNWSPAGTPPETMVYKFAYTMDSAMPNSAQGGTAAVSFTWEAQNT